MTVSHKKKENKLFLTAGKLLEFQILWRQESGKLKCLDPFHDKDPLAEDSISFEGDFLFPEEGYPDLNERYESDSDDKYVWEDNGNVFDVIAVIQIKFHSYKRSQAFVLVLLFVKAYS